MEARRREDNYDGWMRLKEGQMVLNGKKDGKKDEWIEDRWI